MGSHRSLLRIHAHAWFVAAAAVAVFWAFLALKFVQLYVEQQIDTPDKSHTDRVKGAWDYVFHRRLDDPSLWAVMTIPLAAWLVTKAATYLSATMPLPHFVWTRDLRCWSWLVGMSVLSLGAYLTGVYFKHETFWWAPDPNYSKAAEASQSLIPVIQWIEGCVNVAIILLACSLVPVVRALAMRVEVHDKKRSGDEPRDAEAIRLARARLATLGVGPFSLLASAFFVYTLLPRLIGLIGGTGFSPIDAILDYASGLVGALFICSPMLIATWRFWWHSKRRHQIVLKCVCGAALLVWALRCVWRRDVAGPPDWLVDDDQVPDWAQVPVKFANTLGYLGSGVLLWYLPYDPPAQRTVHRAESQ